MNKTFALMAVLLLLLGIVGIMVTSAILLGGGGDSTEFDLPRTSVSETNVAIEYSITASETAVSRTVAQPRERIVITNGDLSVIVEDVPGIMTQIRQMTREMEGWVVNSNTSAYTNRAGDRVQRGSISIRIPADRLDEAMTRIKDSAVEMQTENVRGEDVTQTYVDLESRLRNLEAAETQLQKIMDEASTTNAVLDVYKQLVQTRGEIEVIRGQLTYYTEASAYSILNVSLNPPEPEEKEEESDQWSVGGIIDDATDGLVGILRFLLALLIWIVIVILPIALILGLPGWVIYRFVWPRFRS